jgi:hypothetical protein
MFKFNPAFLLLLLTPFLHAAPEIKPEVVELLKPKLNSDRILHFFGHFGVEPVPITSSPFGESRITNLYSIHGHQKVMRTLAVVSFKQPVDTRLKLAHKEICQGEAVGIALRKNGWTIDKVPVYFGSVSLSPQVQEWMHEKKLDQAAIHIYKLHVFKENSTERLYYCTIIEVHSPQYLDQQWLRLLYPQQYDQFSKKTPEVDLLMESLNTLIKSFPLVIGLPAPVK